MFPRKPAVLTFIVVCLLLEVACSKVQLPQTLRGEWWEEKPRQGELRQVLRFEQQGERALVYVGKAAEIGLEPAEWSAPYEIKRGAGDGWAFRLGERDVGIALRGDGRLGVTGLLATVVGMRVKDDGSVEPVTDDKKPIETVFASLASYRKVTMWFSVSEGGAGFTFIGPTRNPQVQLRKNQAEIRWCFGNINLINHEVSELRLTNFVDAKNPSNRNPFGDRTDAANQFDLGTAAPNAEVCSQYIPVVQEGVFDYRVTATVRAPQGKKQTVTTQDVLSIAP